MDIKRAIFQKLITEPEANKVLLLYGPRRVGKTFLLEKLASALADKEKVKFVSGENRIIQEALSGQIIEKFKDYLGETTLLIIDEAHKIPNIEINLKLIVDHISGIKVIASGSASLTLSQKVGEPLTGRKKTLKLFPVSTREVIDTFGIDYHKSLLQESLIFGGFPEIFSKKSPEEKAKYLHELIDSYLLKDILEIGLVKKPKVLVDLLTLLAFQIGDEVSLTEIGGTLSLHKDTVARYLDLLEKAFVIVNVRGFSRNLRKEVTKNSRYYFYDNGVRNALINNFNPLKMRNDVGSLWENFLVMERLKRQSYAGIFSNNYFWRTYDQKEIDWVEMREGKLFGYEIKWGREEKSKARNEWLKTYKEAEFQVVNPENYLDFIL